MIGGCKPVILTVQDNMQFDSCHVSVFGKVKMLLLEFECCNGEN